MGLVLGERTAVHIQGAPEIVQDGAPAADVGEVESFTAAATVATDGLVARERAVLDREGPKVVDGAADAAADEELVGAVDAAVAAKGLVADERAAGDGGGRGRTPDGAATGGPAVVPAEGLIAEERAAGDGEGAPASLLMAPPRTKLFAPSRSARFVVGQDVVGERQVLPTFKMPPPPSPELSSHGRSSARRW